MSHEKHGYAEIVSQIPQDFQDAGLHGNVERGGRFVGKKKIGVRCQRHGDHDALAHAARKFVWVGASSLFGIAYPDLLHHLDGPALGLFTGNFLVNEDGFGHLIDDSQVGVKATHGILKDHGYAFPPDGPEQGRRQPDQLLPVEGHRAAFDLGRRLGQKAKHGVAGDGLAGTGFPHDPNDFLFVDGEADVVHRPGRACSGMEIGFQILYVEQAHQSLAAFTSRASRSPSPRKLREKRVREKKRPGSRSS